MLLVFKDGDDELGCGAQVNAFELPGVDEICSRRGNKIVACSAERERFTVLAAINTRQKLYQQMSADPHVIAKIAESHALLPRLPSQHKT